MMPRCIDDRYVTKQLTSVGGIRLGRARETRGSEGNASVSQPFKLVHSVFIHTDSINVTINKSWYPCKISII